MYILPIFLSLSTILPLTLAVCGYESCPVPIPNMLNVHVICHTHDDVGWVRTVEEYYQTYVKHILNSVVRHLLVNETRKFIYVESAFLHRWWSEQSQLSKFFFKKLINNGQLEIISGGWSMNDEATTHYLAIIDQMTLGMRWLNDTFGPCATPKIGWQIDPFGHSREQASIFSQMHFHGLFLGRIDYQDKQFRQQTKNLEFLWNTNPGYNLDTNIFTGILPNVYWPPQGFCFDDLCGEPEITSFNINRKARHLMDIIRQQANYYRTNHTVLTMGMDFHYRDADRWFRNLDRLMAYINNLQESGSSINMFYSTPSCYLHSLSQANLTWSTFTEDFFPYASDPDAYWTGYFTSKPSIKRFTRYANGFLQACKQVIALTNISEDYSFNLRKAMGVMQHHDAVTGTEKDYVAKDYAAMLTTGIEDCELAFNEAYRAILEGSGNTFSEHFFCQNLNISECYWSENEIGFFLVVYNPQPRWISEYVRLPVVAENYLIIDNNNNELPIQLSPISNQVQVLPERLSWADRELIFPVSVPPLGVSVYQVFQQGGSSDEFTQETHAGDVTIENENLKVVIESRTGLMKEIILGDLQVPLRQSFYWYEAQPGFRHERPSGAYAFNPRFDYAYSLHENVTFRVNKGPLVEEVHQTFTPWLSQTIRVYKGEHHVEFDWTIGPIPIDDRLGKEIITTYETSLDTQGYFYTDSNARQTMKRKRDFRSSFPLNLTEKVASNYYPINSWIHIKDEDRKLQMTILTDRAQGASSIYDGSIEIMLHRRLLFDDGFGVEEPLNEIGIDGRGVIVRGKHWLLLRPTGDSLYRQLAQRMFLPPILSFTFGNFTDIAALDQFSGLKSRLPGNINLLTLELLGKNILLRLEHFYGFGEHPVYSKPTNVSLEELFTPFTIVGAREMSLGANIFLEESNKLRWNDQYPDENDEDEAQEEVEDENLTISFQPMQIRTFLLSIQT